MPPIAEDEDDANELNPEKINREDRKSFSQVEEQKESVNMDKLDNPCNPQRRERLSKTEKLVSFMGSNLGNNDVR